MSWLIFVIQTKWIVCACVKMSTLSFMFWRQIISMQEQQGVFTTHIKPIWNGLTITSKFNRCSISFYPQNLRKILKLLIQWLILCVAEGRFEFVMWVCSHYNQHIAQAMCLLLCTVRVRMICIVINVKITLSRDITISCIHQISNKNMLYTK